MTVFGKYRFSCLLSSLLVLLIITPLVHDFTIVRIALSLFFSYILISSVFAISGKTLFLRIGILLAAPSFLLNWLYSYHQNLLIERIALSADIICFTYLTLVLFLNLKQVSQITFEVIAAGLSVFLLLGLLWSFIFSLIESFFPGSFSGIDTAAGDPRFRFLYFSFVTLTTLGYGDVAATKPIAQSWTVLEAVIGQIYLVVIISGLVAIVISNRFKRKEPFAK